MSRIVWLSVLPLAMMACTGGGVEDPDPPKDDDTGLNEGPHCEATETEVALDEETALGFAPQVLVDYADGEHAVTLSWTQGGDTPMALTATLDGRVLFVDEEAVYPTGTGDYPAIAVYCEDYVAIEGSLSFATEDGQLAETVEVAFRSYDGVLAEAFAELDPNELGGSLVFDDHHGEMDYDERALVLNAAFDATGTRGSVSGTVSGSGECEPGEPCTAWQGIFDIGTWGQED